MIGKLPDFFKSPHKISGKPQNSPVLLALSGGSDSACLLRLMSEASKAHHFELSAAHVNHGIRGEKYGCEADRDEAFCQEICRELGIKLFVKRVDVPALAQSSGESLETAAREARYGFFAEIMLEHGIEILATAHNADDNFETQLFNLCRGCGIDGICGIPESRPFTDANGIIVRPILSASKIEILRYCETNGVQYVTDSTNFEDDCVRNKLRLNIIPQLKEIFSTPERSAARLATYAKEDSDFIDQEAERLLSTFGNGISVEILSSTHPAIAKRMIRSAFAKYSQKSLESVHVENVMAFASEKKSGQISLPDELSACFENGLLFFRSEKTAFAETSPYCVPLSFGVNYIEDTDFAVFIGETPAKEIPEGYETYDTAEIFSSSPLTAKNRCEGDRILTGGMHKRIKKLMCDKKIFLRDRETLPLIYADNEIIYAPQCARSDLAKNKDGTKITISIFKKTYRR